LNIYLTQNDGVPVYQQIIKQVKQLIASQRLLIDQELPPIRVLAETLLINPNTVARAYRELENAGWVYKKRGAGTFVSKQQTPLSRISCKEQLSERIAGLLAEAHHMNISVDEIITMIQQQAQQK